MAKGDFAWDDLRIILAVARKTSLRAGADALRMHHSSVARRIDNFEQAHGMRLFDRHQRGYVPTATGEELCRAAEEMESAVLAVARRTAGRETRLVGQIRITVPSPTATHLLLPDILAFASQHPGIEIDLVGSTELFDLSRRDADIAVRVTRESPPDHLIGRRAARCAFALYESAAGVSATRSKRLAWSPGIADQRGTGTVRSGKSETSVRFSDLEMHLAACRAGFGRAKLPCFIGDRQGDLRRVKGVSLDPGPDLWILVHRDLMGAARIKACTDALWKSVRTLRPLIEGQRPYSRSEEPFA